MSIQPTKAELVAKIQAEYTQLEAILSKIPEAQMTQPGVEAAWSVKDLLAHITWWQQRLLQMLQCAARGEQPPSLLAAGEDWAAAMDRLNMGVFSANRERPLQAIREELRHSFEQVVETIASASEHDLFDAQGFERIIGRSIVEVIAGDTYAHYQEHGETIRAWIAGRAPTTS